MKYSKNILILLYISATILFECCCTEVCIKESPCICQLTENTKIDITSLLDKQQYLEESAEVLEGDEKSIITYYFSGCKNHIFENITASLIQKHNIKNSTSSTWTTLGLAKDIKFNKDAVYQIIYQNGSGVSSTINLICDLQIKQPYLKVIHVQNNEFVVSSPEVCIKTDHHGLSGGSVFLIILIVVGAIYFVGGALILYFIRGARGQEMIPNVDFWKNLPGLVKDGVIFLLSGCKPTFVTTAETYNRI
ncbi:hypothetical protein JTB14_033452 [Gonioctena quinquepunctata]|nr:hypothetical protein JTB14_033452 [Gonioctena quinquepunctata]